MKFTTLFAVFIAAAVHALPVNIIPPIVEDVFSPDITSPQLGTVWIVGQNATVTWNADDVPQTNANSTGLILLGYEDDNSGNENLDTQSPLASNFPISAGSISFTVPNVTARNDYIVVLFGDSGNASPIFTIKSA